MADDLIASARAMSVSVEGQYNTLGLPQNSLTPATITAMVGFAQGKGLAVNPFITGALDKIQSHTENLISGIAPGITSALANANVSITGISISANPTAAVDAIKAAAAADGIMVDTATETALTQAITTASGLNGLSSKIMAGGPAGFMSKFNAVRAHLGDAIELKKVTAFMSNVKLSSFGTGMKDLSSLATNGLDGVMGDLKAAAAAMGSAGAMFDTKDMASFGSAAGMIKKLSSIKLGNASGANEAMAKAGVDLNDINNPIYADKIKLALNGIKNPKILNSVAAQTGIKPAAGLPESLNNNLTGAFNKIGNPFKGLPSQAPANPNAAADLLSPPQTSDPASSPASFNSSNDERTFGTTVQSTDTSAEDIKAQIDALFKIVIDGAYEIKEDTNKIIADYDAIDVKAADAQEKFNSVRESITATYKDKFGALDIKMVNAANATNPLIKSLPIKTNAQKIERNSYVDQRDGPIESLIKNAQAMVRNAVKDQRLFVQGKITAAKGGLAVTTS
jgi:hypothetical protein